MRRLFLAVCAIALADSPTVAARTWHVPADAPTIAAALDSASVGDVVLVACGTYHEHGLRLPSGVTLRSETGEPGCVTIDAGHLDSVIICEGAAIRAVIEGFTLTRGLAWQGPYPSGGGLLCRDAVLSVRHCRFVANTAGWGGGLYAYNADIEVSDCRFESNQADIGGAAIDCAGGKPIFTRCEIVGNVGVNTSAAIRTAHTDATFTDCLIAGNDLPVGGVVFNGLDSRLALDGCTVADQPQDGIVGLFLQNSVVTGAGNVATGIGGPAVLAGSSTVVNLEHATLAANGAGIVVLTGSAATLHACLIAFNVGAGIEVHGAAASVTCSNVVANLGGNYVGQLADQTGSGGNISLDPLFCDLAAGNLALDAASPCLPSGNLCFVQIGAFGQGCSVTAAPAAAMPAHVALQARPNPFNPQTTLSFDLPVAATVRLEIIALDGARVAGLLDEIRPAGRHEVAWQGRDDQGRRVPAGVYLARLVAAGAASVQRLVLVP